MGKSEKSEEIAAHEDEFASNGTIKSLGLVFGDIGTSPIYTLTVIFLLTRPTQDHVIGVLSLIVWTLVILVTHFGGYPFLRHYDLHVRPKKALPLFEAFDA